MVAYGIRSDVDELDDLLSRVRLLRAAGDHAGAVSMLDVADGLLDGELYTDALDGRCLGDDSWAVQAQEHVASVQSEIRTLQAESALEVGDLHQAVDRARRAILSDPSWQRPHGVLMQALAALGEVDQAMNVYDRLQVALRKDSGDQLAARTPIRDQIQWALDDLAPDEVGSLEEHMLRWLRERARGARMRVQAAFDDGRYEAFPIDLTLGPEGAIEVAANSQDVLWSQDA